MSSSNSNLFSVAIATIFAREFLEGSLIIGNYRTIIIRNDEMSEEEKKLALRTVTVASLYATTIAVVVVLATAIPLGILSHNLEDDAIELIEGISKLIASFCILQLSLKIPVWLGVYDKIPLLPWKKHVMTWCNGSFEEHKKEEVDIGTLTQAEIRFNVIWNIWREVAECGVFLIPFFLGSETRAIPVSAVVGSAIALFLGILIYIANHKLENKTYLAIFMVGLTGFLAVGLFVGSLGEFEERLGETKVVYEAEKPFWDSSNFPMVLLKPFGYSSERTVLTITGFWLFLSFGLSLHYLKWRNTKISRSRKAEEKLQEPSSENDLEVQKESSNYDKETSSEDEAPMTA